MKRLMAIALVVAGVALPACAQRGGARGGFSGHSAPAFHGSFAPANHFSYAGGPVASGSRFAGAAPAYRAGFRPVRHEPVGVRGRFYGVGNRYGYGAGWVAPYYPGYPDDGVADGPVTAPDGVDDGSQSYVAAAPPDQGPPLPDAGSYQAYPEPPALPPPALAPAQGMQPEDAVTLIFKDGRPPEKIHNYALTRTTLYVRDQHKRDIPVEDLDLVATEKANRDAGVEFQLPVAK
jgi:hypothetical protein